MFPAAAEVRKAVQDPYTLVQTRDLERSTLRFSRYNLITKKIQSSCARARLALLNPGGRVRMLQEAKMQTMKTSTLALTLLIISGSALAQENQFGNIAERQRTSTVLGGTGMFNTFSTRTLYKGEFNFAAFWNRFNRDPGGLRIDQAPFNFTIGLTNRWELWVDWVTWQKTRSNNPLLLSGYQYNAVRLFGDPVQIHSARRVEAMATRHSFRVREWREAGYSQRLAASVLQPDSTG